MKFISILACVLQLQAVEQSYTYLNDLTHYFTRKDIFYQQVIEFIKETKYPIITDENGHLLNKMNAKMLNSMEFARSSSNIKQLLLDQRILMNFTKMNAKHPIVTANETAGQNDTEQYTGPVSPDPTSPPYPYRDYDDYDKIDGDYYKYGQDCFVCNLLPWTY